MPVSGNTLLRLIRSAHWEAPEAPRVIGIDAWAWKRGQTYGTILCDLDKGRVLDLLPDREAGTVSAWLKRHPGVVVTPQAKGRVERANQTLQDRLVKELRLMGISSIDAANAVLPQFVAAWNGKFAVDPREDVDAHRAWDDTPDALDDRLARRDERTLSKALTFRSEGTVYCVKTKGVGIALRGAKVELHHRLDGTMTVHYKDRILPVTAFQTYPVPDPAEDEKTIDLRVDHIVAAQRAAALATLEVGRG